ncbi:MAG TPA: tRNA lysidine(34) synthetase TilS [Burkholderiaceae bacterium]|nr:tRNA lysidine(34) synthetase TilS [Burkholderiaceae bacterium]
MAASKRHATDVDAPRLSAFLTGALARALDALPGHPGSFAAGVSGGVDSAMLAVHAAALARERGLNFHIFHVHHGLQEPSAQWQSQVHDLAQALRVPCHSRCIRVDGASGKGIEAAAREARYATFVELAELVGIRHLLLAHHRDDQAETVLLRLLRGAGPSGLAAMAPVSHRDGLTYVRPWLELARARILDAARRYGEHTGWQPVRDPTNHDDQYTRAAVRERLVPDLNERWPGWQGVLVRHARLSAEARDVLDEVAARDLAGLDCVDDGASFSLRAWRELSPARQALVLRHWLDRLGQRMPSEARLNDVMRQLRGLHALGHDRDMRVRHGAVWIRCRAGRVFLDGAPGPCHENR